MTAPDRPADAYGDEGAARGRTARYDTFDVLRIFAALLVLVYHALALSGTPLRGGGVLDRIGLTYGRAGVAIFFTTSGYLVTRSWMRDPSPARFAARRVRRIWPALLVMLVVLTFVLGPLVTNVSLRDYVDNSTTWQFFGHDVLLSSIHYVLPGLFGHNPVPYDVNGSLWTLPYEVLAYVALLVLGVLGLLPRRWLLLGGLAALLVLYHSGVAAGHLHLASHQFEGMNGQDLVRLWAFFFAGAVLYQFRDSVRTTPTWVAGAVALLGVCVAARWATPAVVLFAYVTVSLGTRPWAFARRVHRLGDPSYGIYIYAYPIQQALISRLGQGHGWEVLVLSAPLSAAAGYLSWHVVERPAIRWRPRRVEGRLALT